MCHLVEKGKGTYDNARQIKFYGALNLVTLRASAHDVAEARQTT